MAYNQTNSTGRALLVTFLLILFLLPHARGHADMYSWTDEDGVKHFSNEAPDNSSGKIRKTEEYIQEDKGYDAEPPEPSDEPKVSDIQSTIDRRQKRTGSRPQVNISFKYYDFVSVNTNDIKGVMWKKSPVRNKGQAFSASTRSRINYHFTAMQEDGIWYIDRVSTTVDVIFTMPKWANYRNATREQQQKWDTYYNSLMAHENGHKDIAVEGAKEIENELLKLNLQSERELKLAADSKAGSILRNVRYRQKKYDEKTGHGNKTGVVLQ